MKFAHNLGIRGKIIAMVISIVLLLSAGIIIQVRAATTYALSDYLQRHGVSIAETISARSVHCLVQDDISTLRQLKQEALENHDNVEYVLITDGRGGVEISSFDGGPPEHILRGNAIPREQSHSITTLKLDQHTIYDIAVPIDGEDGTVRVGMSTTEVDSIILGLSQNILLQTLVVAIFGLVVTYFLSALISKPILELVTATEQVSMGKLQDIPLSRTRDEIGRLTHSFQKMIHALKEMRGINESYRNQLEAKEQMRKKLLNKMINAQEDERKRISRELHDSTGQTLTSLKLALKQLGNAQDMEDVRELSEELRELTGDVLDEIKDIARDLRPSTLDDLGLLYALDKHLQEIQERTGIPTELCVEDASELELETEISTNVYRIVQEAVTNAIKHADPNHISVGLEVINQKLIVIIEDDGTGFDPDKIIGGGSSNKGLGLFGMQERAELIGGQLTIESKPGAGTTLYLKVDLT